MFVSGPIVYCVGVGERSRLTAILSGEPGGSGAGSGGVGVGPFFFSQVMAACSVGKDLNSAPEKPWVCSLHSVQDLYIPGCLPARTAYHFIFIF